MKKIFLSLLVLFSAISTLLAREVYDFSSSWEFAQNIESLTKSEKVNLPHSWNSSDTNDGYYMKEFKMQQSWVNKKVYLRFGGASSVATVLVNGRFVGEHKGAYGAFNLDITPYINYSGYNTVLVNVSAAPRMDILPFCSEDSHFAGLYRKVELIIVDRAHLSLSNYGSDGAYLTTKTVADNKANIEALLMLKGAENSTVTATVSMSFKGKEVARIAKNIDIDSRGEREVILPITVTTPKLWGGTESPNLYDVKVEVSQNGAVKDCVEFEYGIRTLTLSNGTLLLNGKKYQVNGVTRYQDRDKIGSAFLDVHQKEDVELIKEIGANGVKATRGMQNRYFYSLLDREGIMAWVNLPLSASRYSSYKGFIDSYDFKENGIEQLKEMIYQLYNHPSFCFAGIFNNLSSSGDTPIPYISELNQLSHRIAPNIITVGSSIEDGAINQITDAIGWPIYYGVDGELSDLPIWARQISSRYSNLNPSITEYGYPAHVFGSVHHQEVVKIRNRTFNEYEQARFHYSYIQTLKKYPAFWSTFMNSMFDYSSGADKQLLSGNKMGVVTYDRHYKKDAFYLYKANWNRNDKFVWICSKLSPEYITTNREVVAYSNIEKLKLVVNGKEYSETSPIDGRASWKNIIFKEGNNHVTVSGDGFSDSYEFEYYKEL